MYDDYKPCEVCGAEVRLRESQKDRTNEPDGPVDQRVCTNDACETNQPDSTAQP